MNYFWTKNAYLIFRRVGGGGVCLCVCEGISAFFDNKYKSEKQNGLRAGGLGGVRVEGDSIFLQRNQIRKNGVGIGV